MLDNKRLLCYNQVEDKDVYGVLKMRENLTGKTFGLLTVVGPAPDKVSTDGKHRISMWRCRCVCGAEVITRGSSLKSGHTKGCGQKHRAVQNMTGFKTGRLTVIERAPDYINADGTKHVMWRCRCECGRESVVRGTALRNGSIQSCGCLRNEKLIGIGQEDLTGQTFGYWTVLYEAGRLREPRGRIVPMWHCRCKCGTERDIRAGTLKSGQSLSCGCYKYERLSELSHQGFGISKAEQVVNKYLTDTCEYFETQKIYPDLKSKSGYPLFYDFLAYKDGEPYILIECQGVQHYRPVEYFGGEKQFAVQQANDNLKRKYAARLKLPLVEVPYTCNTEDSIIQLVSPYFEGK